MDRSRSERMMIRAAVVLAAISIILVCFAFTQISWPIGRIILICCAAVPFSIAAFLVYLVILGHLSAKGGRNFFLYDRKTRTNMPPESLTVAHVSECLTMYMSLFCHKRQLYISSLFDEDGGAPEVFKPLFCYQLLGMLSASEEEEQLNAFLSCGKELADAFAIYLTQADEEALSRDVQAFIAEFDGKNIAPFRNYLRRKSDYLAARMLEYTKMHIHEFD